MLRLAVATQAKTFERLEKHLPERGIEPIGLSTTGRTMPIAGKAADLLEASGSTVADCDVGFVFPPRLAEGGVADAHLDIPWVNDREALLRSRFKAEALARLHRDGHPIANSVVVSNPVDETKLVETFERFDPPVVVKPNSTTRGRAVALAHDLDSFLGICDYLDLLHDYRATRDRSFLVQEFLPDASDYRAMVVDGEYVGAVERTAPADAGTTRWKHNVHRGGQATGVELPPECQALVEGVADTLDIPWLGVDLLVTAERTVVNETNARPTIDSATKYESDFWASLATLIRSHA